MPQQVWVDLDRGVVLLLLLACSLRFASGLGPCAAAARSNRSCLSLAELGLNAFKRGRLEFARGLKDRKRRTHAHERLGRV